MISLRIFWGEAREIGEGTEKQHCSISIPAVPYLVHVSNIYHFSAQWYIQQRQVAEANHQAKIQEQREIKEQTQTILPNLSFWNHWQRRKEVESHQAFLKNLNLQIDICVECTRLNDYSATCVLWEPSKNIWYGHVYNCIVADGKILPWLEFSKPFSFLFSTNITQITPLCNYMKAAALETNGKKQVSRKKEGRNRDKSPREIQWKQKENKHFSPPHFQ